MIRFLSIGIAVLSFIIAILYQTLIPPHLRGVIEQSNDDPPIEIELLNISSSWKIENVSQLFSLSYDEARMKFRTAVHAIHKAELHTITIYTDTTTRMEYTMDIAILPGTTNQQNSNNNIIHISGTHGIEGYAGSAIQLAILEYYLKEQQQEHDQQEQTIVERPTIILIHALNPYGMNFYRRQNENNVDLNRNAIRPQDEHVVIKHQQQKQQSVDIEIRNELKRLGGGGSGSNDDTGEETLPTYYDCTIGYWPKVVSMLWTYGFPVLKRAFVTGQYTDPTNIMYGGSRALTHSGSRMESSIHSLYDFLTTHELLPHTDVVIDVHTGLGKFGMDTLMMTGDVGELSTLFPTAASIVTSTSTDKAAMSGYEESVGFVVEFLQDAQQRQQQQQQQQAAEQDGGTTTTNNNNIDEQSSPPQTKGLFLVQEFGTIPTLLVGRALILENRIHHAIQQYKKTNNYQLLQQQQQSSSSTTTTSNKIQELDTLEEYRRTLSRDAFYPQASEWRRHIIQRGFAVFQQAVEYSNKKKK